MDKRQEKGFEIAKQKQVQTVKNGWLVKSQSNDGFYKVLEDFICDCPDSELHNSTCKHAYAVRYYLDIERHRPEGITNERIRLTYKQAWSAYNKAQTLEGDLFDTLLVDLLKEVMDPLPPQVHGRPRVGFNTGLFVAIKKVYTQMSSRRAVSAFGVSKERGQIEKVPHFNHPSVLLNRTDLTPVLQDLIAITSAPLRTIETNFAIDSTGFRTCSFGAYCEDKYGTKKQHRWLKAHVSVGTKTNIITAVRITSENGADSPQFIPLLERTAQNGFMIDEAYTDKAYLSRTNLSFVDGIGGTPYIPFKSNSKGAPQGSKIWRQMFHYFAYNKEEFLSHYHNRSNIESTFSALKKTLGETLKSKNVVAQNNELLCKIIAYNITVLIHEMHELGIEPDFANAKLSL